MKALLMVAHGSRLKSSNEEFAVLAQRVEASLGNAFDRTATAFLELAEPYIDTALLELINQGATDIEVMPCFLLAGTHVRNDIPGIVASVRERHPDVRIHLREHLAAEPDFVAYLAAQASQG
ncbi:CbiX/SirB N-terminal domain-containing protein [Salinispirillum sp. LH 10-3-1]|uniref:CbiX/SirB N-terminal domain-containing protein n=1 Tax=Salinispirillum sp. LH 10-3-1 TaxID=2952525 RepID=A0AB38YBP0_9GAMM